MRRPRMTIRVWMLAMAVIAVAMSGLVGARAIWQYFMALHRVQYHAGWEGTMRWLDRVAPEQSQAIAETMDQLEKLQRITSDARLHEEIRATLEQSRAALDQYRRFQAGSLRLKEYHAAMVRKYQYVARFPWLPVEPDPPEPKR